MYSWGDAMDDWARPDAYKFAEARKEARAAFAAAAEDRGGRTYQGKTQPNVEVTSPKKAIISKSKNPLVVAIDVTGSMSGWPRELFDRLPLLYQTLSQYRDDLEISFVAIGDAGCDKWPLQVTDFAKGFDLEDRGQALYGEGGGGDAPESYQLFAHYMATRVEVPAVDVETGPRPFLIIFGDARFHPKVLPDQVKKVLGETIDQPLDGIATWREVAKRWNVFFLRRPDGGHRGDGVHAQWAEALGSEKIVYVDNELRGMDYAMGIIARSWGSFEDFQANMRARQSDDQVSALANSVLALDASALAAADDAATDKRAGKKKKSSKAGEGPKAPPIPDTVRS